MDAFKDDINVFKKMQHKKCHHHIKANRLKSFIEYRGLYKLDIIQIPLCHFLFGNREQFTGDINARNRPEIRGQVFDL